VIRLSPSAFVRLIWCGSCYRPTVLLAGEPCCLWCELRGVQSRSQGKE